MPEREIKSLEVMIRDSKSGVSLQGTFRIPPAPKGWVIFAHGSGSSRFSPRNIQVASALNKNHLATLLFDLLSEEESANRKNIFDITLLSERLILSYEFVKNRIEYNGKGIALFGASTGAAAALKAASILGPGISAVVSRGGRVDLAQSSASEVQCPVLLLVGGWDEPVLSWNRDLLPRLKRGRLKVISGATHLFEEPGTLHEVISSASDFLGAELSEKPSRAPGPGLFPLV